MAWTWIHPLDQRYEVVNTVSKPARTADPFVEQRNARSGGVAHAKAGSTQLQDCSLASRAFLKIEVDLKVVSRERCRRIDAVGVGLMR
jgi:hypothetical protein